MGLVLALGGVLGAGARLQAEDYSIITYAGTGSVAGAADGTPGTFNNPYGIALDADRNLYVSDTLNNTIRKITPARVVSTLAGSAGLLGSTDGTGSAARFSFPVGLAVDAAGNVYVADNKNFTIRKITPAGVVTTHAGAAGQAGAVDGPAATARFLLPFGVAVDSGGNLYVADGGNQTIRRISAAGVVSTLAGAAGQAGFADGAGANARFNFPWGVTVDRNGNVFVADSENHVIRRVTPAGVVTTFAGAAGNSGAADGTGVAARFNQPRGLSVDAAGNLYVADHGNSTVRHITPTGLVTTLAGSAGITADVDSVGAAARFYYTTDVLADGTTIYVVDSSNNTIRRGVPASQAPLPLISIHPLEQNVAAGQAVTFRVVASGGALTYTWLKDNLPIAGATAATYSIASPGAGDEGVYAVRVAGPGGSVDSQRGSLTVWPIVSGPISITARPLSQSVNPGQSVTFSVAASGAGLTYQWQKNGVNLAGATGASYTLPSAQIADAGTYTVRLAAGTAVETPFAKLVVGGSAGDPVTIVAPPRSQSVNAGQGVTFSVTATGSGALAYQWLKNDAPIAGATGTSYAIASAQPADAGNYAVRVSGGGANVLSATAVLTVIVLNPAPAARLSNLSVRTNAGTGDNTLIVGFALGGAGTSGSGAVLLRGVGPTLGAFGVGGALADPLMTVFQGTTQVAANDDWAGGFDFSSVGAFNFAGSPPRDAAIHNPALPANSYSIQILGKNNTTGIALAEIYNATPDAVFTGTTPRLVNVSARTQVGTGDEILITGFVVTGTAPLRVLVRAVGPTLQAFGVGGVLADPKLDLFRDSAKIAENDNWEAATAATFAGVGAFAFTPGSRDAALVATLEPGAYTAQVSGVGATTGVALVEVYELR
jgi:sugar lactone lactonase YvrE